MPNPKRKSESEDYEGRLAARLADLLIAEFKKRAAVPTPDPPHKDALDRLHLEIFTLFPIGAKYYDCLMDDGVIIHAHLPMFGLLCFSTGPRDFTAIHFGSLLNGRLVQMHDKWTRELSKKHMTEYHAVTERLSAEYKELVKDKEVWS